MKRLILLFVLLSAGLFAQKPEKIYGITIQPHEVGYYNTQAGLWKAEVAKRPKDASVWENYYRAMRYSNQAYNKGNDDKQKIMKQIVDDMAKNVPATIEYYRCKLSFDGWPNKDTIGRVSMMNKALALAPNDRSVLEDYVVYCETSGHLEKLNAMATTMYKSNTYANGVMEMGYNIMMSADKNAIVFTCGDNDTFPEWMLQEAKGVRTDLDVINIPLCMNFPNYLKRMLKKKNIVLADDFWSREQSVKDMNELMKMLALEINKTNPEVPVFFAITCDLQSVFPDSLYCTGLTWLYSPVRVDNVAKMKNNIENHFHLDYLNGGITDENAISKDIVEDCNELYVTPFALLYKHYKSMRESNDRSVFYKDFVMKYAVKGGKEQEMKEYLDGK
jgi:hypothetical protein